MYSIESPEDRVGLKADISLIIQRIARLLRNDLSKLAPKNYTKLRRDQNVMSAHTLAAYVIYLLESLKEQGGTFTEDEFEAEQKSFYAARQDDKSKDIKHKLKSIESPDRAKYLRQRAKALEANPDKVFEEFSKEVGAANALFATLISNKKSFVNFYGDSDLDFSPETHHVDALSQDSDHFHLLSAQTLKTNYRKVRSFHRNGYKINFLEDSVSLVGSVHLINRLSKEESLLQQIQRSENTSEITQALRALKHTTNSFSKTLGRAKQKREFSKDQEGRYDVIMQKGEITQANVVYESILRELKANIKTTLTARKGFFARRNNALIDEKIQTIADASSISAVDKAIKEIIDNYQPKGGLYKIAHWVFKLKHRREFTKNDTDTVQALNEYRISYGLAAPAA